MYNKYENQVRLLVRCLPAIRKEECFAIKGGTALNLFCLDMPRLSVDIDLVYLNIENRETTYKNIYIALDRLKERLEKIGLTIHKSNNEATKLICYDGVTEIKIEPNYTLRGYVFEPRLMEVCNTVQNLYGYAKAKVVSIPELWGGKICAALDRQHPRDLFDIKNLFATTGITENIKQGFIAMLLAGNRPLHEILNPNFQMRESAIKNEFEGMCNMEFTFADAEHIFNKLVQAINFVLTKEDKNLLLDFVQLKADLSVSSIPNLNVLPGIQWKIKNLKTLRKVNPKKFEEQYTKLKDIL